MKEIIRQSKGAKNVASTDIAVFFAVCWIVLALILSPLFRIRWLVPGDFSYTGAMYYHAIIVPVLILLYLLTIKILHLRLNDGRAYSAGAMFSILFVGIGSIFNVNEGISVAAVVQIVGMVMTDILGIILVVVMAMNALGKNANSRKTGAVFWLLFSSIIAILIAAPLGHFAGWCIDTGAKSIPGLHILLNATSMKPDDFQDGLVASHSHLIVAAVLCGLAALAAIFFQYQSRGGWRKRMSILGLWTTFVSILLATGIYVFSAMSGWEPPVLFASGPSGIPLDDVILTLQQIGFLILMAGLTGSLKSTGTKFFASVKATIRTGIFANWIFGFAGAVLTGVYIELNEGFYGTGVSPAPGAMNDNIFIRAHLLYPFLLLPIIFAVTLAVGYKYDHSTVPHLWPKLYIWTSIIGMSGGLAGEILWFTTEWNYVLVAAIIVMGMALITGVISLWPGTGAGRSYHTVS